MQIHFHLKSFLVLIFVTQLNLKKIEEFDMIEGGGYTARFWLNFFHESVFANNANNKILFTCNIFNRSESRYGNHSLYLCKIPCKYEDYAVKIIKHFRKFKKIKKPIFKLPNEKLKKEYESNDNLTIYTTQGDLSLLMIDEIKIYFSANISCSIKQIQNKSIICQLDLSKIAFDQKEYVNVSVNYGYDCTVNQFVEKICIINSSKFMKFIKLYLKIISPFLVILIILTVIAILGFMRFRNNKTIQHELQTIEKQLKNQKIEFSNMQRKAFLEYQTAVNSFNNLGKLTPRHMLSFNDYISRIFNVEFNKKSMEHENDDDLNYFQSVLLNKVTLIDWIDKVERRCQTKQRSLVASLLTLVLFQHPLYFLDIMKSLLENAVSQMKKNSEEKLLFRRTEGMVESMIGNWISLCMYQNIKTGETGKRLFNLYRAIKCKIETGFVDVYMNKAKYALNYDHVMFGEFEYDVLNINVSVHVQLKLMDSTQKPLEISLKSLQVEVISLDTISQVKDKILDKAIMVFAEKENQNFLDDKMNFAIAKTDHNELSLKWISKTIQLPLQDLDYSSINVDGEYTLINTMKHYNMKSEMKFHLTSVTLSESNNVVVVGQHKTPLKRTVHLQMPSDFKNVVNDKKNENTSTNLKLPVIPIFGETNKESYLMHLLGTKKSLSPFIDGFFQCLTNNKPTEFMNSSINSLFDVNESQITDSLLNEYSTFTSDCLQSKDCYTLPVNYLFSMLDQIAESCDIKDEIIVYAWKSNSFILRFWINIIKNPNFIFAVDKSDPVDGSLTTIASVLMESCSSTSANVNINSPIIKQLFLEDVKGKYSVWWQAFIMSVQSVSDVDMAAMMNDIIEKNQMKDHYYSHLRSLSAINNKLPMEEDYHSQ